MVVQDQCVTSLSPKSQYGPNMSPKFRILVATEFEKAREMHEREFERKKELERES